MIKVDEGEYTYFSSINIFTASTRKNLRNQHNLSEKYANNVSIWATTRSYPSPNPNTNNNPKYVRNVQHKSIILPMTEISREKNLITCKRGKSLADKYKL